MADLKSRREFLEFIGKSAAAVSVAGAVPLATSCATPSSKSGSTSGSSSGSSAASTTTAPVPGLPFRPIAPSSEDKLILAEGFQHKILIKWDEVINERGEKFGTNNDYLVFFPLNEEGTDGILWSNHESLLPLFVSGWKKKQPKSREQVIQEQAVLGGSLLRVRKNASGEWEVVKNDKYNRRLSALTPIPIVSPRPIQGSKTAIGTFANCAGGYTPWGTVLTCEENYMDFYGEAVYDEKGNRTIAKSKYRWEEHFPYPPEHYGWVVEVNPLTGDAKKLTSIGRYAHECATVRPGKDGRCVVYSGDDGDNRCLYKFIADKPGSLETGTLYVASLEQGRWIPLTLKDQKALRGRFKDQLDVLIRCREAAPMVGGSLLDRPEDIEVDPSTGAVLVTLTNNQTRGNYFGWILKIEEKNNDPFALEFKWSRFMAGGPENGFACPDNMAFDRRGNLWLTCDIAGSYLNKAPYEGFKNNGLYYIPLHGENAGQVYQVASAPVEAEFTGPFFSPDGRTLFVAIQHPGEETKSLDQLTSTWPEGGRSLPKSSIITLSGPALDKLVEGAEVKPLFKLPVLKPS